MSIIGLTGGIASGKSTIAKMLQELGAEVIDADQVAREIMLPGKPLLEEIAKTFGPEFINSQGALNRSLLATEIFNNDEKREIINKLTHPAIIANINEQIKGIKRKNPKAIIIIEASLLIEAGMMEMMDQLWLVEVNRKLQLERLMQRDGFDYNNALIRVESQMSPEERRKYGDVIFNTDKSLEQLRAEVIKEWQKL